jgi:hypothetical protein
MAELVEVVVSHAVDRALDPAPQLQRLIPSHAVRDDRQAAG